MPENKQMEEQSSQAAELVTERLARAALEESATTLNARITKLEGSLSEAKQANETATAERASLMEAQVKAIGNYLALARAANPAIPAAIIAGATIEEIDASCEKGKGMVEAVRQSVKAGAAAEKAAVKIPAGAPARGGISTEGMSAREKIIAGITQKEGGNS